MNYLKNQVLHNVRIMFVVVALMIGGMFTVSDQALAVKGDGQSIKDKMDDVIAQQQIFSDMIDKSPILEKIPAAQKERIKRQHERSKKQVARTTADELNDLPIKRQRRPKGKPDTTETDTAAVDDLDLDIDMGSEIVDALTDLEKAYEEMNMALTEDEMAMTSSAIGEQFSAQAQTLAPPLSDLSTAPYSVIGAIRPDSGWVIAAFGVMSVARAANQIMLVICGTTVLGNNVMPVCIPTTAIEQVATTTAETVMNLLTPDIDSAEIRGTYERTADLRDDHMKFNEGIFETMDIARDNNDEIFEINAGVGEINKGVSKILGVTNDINSEVAAVKGTVGNTSTEVADVKGIVEYTRTDVGAIKTKLNDVVDPKLNNILQNQAAQLAILNNILQNQVVQQANQQTIIQLLLTPEGQRPGFPNK